VSPSIILASCKQNMTSQKFNPLSIDVLIKVGEFGPEWLKLGCSVKFILSNLQWWSEHRKTYKNWTGFQTSIWKLDLLSNGCYDNDNADISSKLATLTVFIFCVQNPEKKAKN
jgi:hypothetical protein